jgi:hypothetical protein
MKRSMFSLTVSGVVLAGAAIAEDVRWFTTGDGAGAALVYGTPDSGHGEIAVQCGEAGSAATAVLEFEPADATDGMEVPVRLSSAGGEIAISATGVRIEMDDLFLLEGPLPADADIEAVLGAGGELLVEAGAETRAYPLDGAGAAAEAFIDACRR